VPVVDHCRAFRACEFVAVPAEMDVLDLGARNGLLVLYSTNSYRHVIETRRDTDAASGPWQNWGAGAPVLMTNAFRIFPLPLSQDRQFFRARWTQ
jgi:hypothetical protein